MIQNNLQNGKINTDADSFVKGLGLQLARVIKRSLLALLSEKEAVFFAIEHIDDIVEIDAGIEKTSYVTEQDKEYATGFSMNSREIKNTLLIFFDNWCGKVESSESIRFVFYTNAPVIKEKRAGVLKDLNVELPDEPLIQLLIEKDYDQAFPFVLPVFKDYYCEQHRKHREDFSKYMQLWDAKTDEDWRTFFDLIEWNFDSKTGKEIWEENKLLIRELCNKYDLNYSETIVEQLVGKFASRMSEKDFLKRVVHVSEIKAMFLEQHQNTMGKIVKKKAVPRKYPALEMKDDDHGNRFRHDTNLTGYRGREKEIEYLHAFCAEPGYLKWTAICGQGGSGKTRLAYEFCREMEKEGWFVYLPCHAKDWLKYSWPSEISFSYDMLICLDYVKYNIEEIEGLIRLISENGQFPRCKVRIILIERNADDLDELIWEESVVKDYLYSPKETDEDSDQEKFIQLGEMENDELSAIIRDYVHVYNEQFKIERTLSAGDEEEILRAFLSADPDEKRPLWALFTADAWCAQEPLDQWNKSAALQYITKKELRLITEAGREISSSDREQAAYRAAARFAIAMGTYIEDIPMEEIYELTETIFDINRQNLEWILQKTDYLTEDEHGIAALNPDLAGEHLCLRILNDFEQKIADHFFEYILKKYFIEAVGFTQKLHRSKDHCDMLANASWKEKIEKLTYPCEYTYVRKNIFRECRFLKNIILHDRITKIEAGAFRDCENLESVIFPASLEVIGLNAFAGCKSLISVLPSDGRGKEPSIITIQNNAFKGCSSLKNMIIPDSVSSMGSSAFEGCSELEEIIIPRKINKIESETFKNCLKLKTVKFAYRTAKNVIILCDEVFKKCENLCTLKGIERITGIGRMAFRGCRSLTKISFSDKLRWVGESAFSECTELAEVDFSSCNLRGISDRVFYGCGSLETVHLPESLEVIGSKAFCNCERLVHIQIPQKVKEIGSYAFDNCVSLQSLELPSEEIRVKDHAIAGCRRLDFFSMRKIANTKKHFCGFAFSAITEKEIRFLASYVEEEYVKIPDTVIQIGAQAFYGHRRLVQVQIPTSVTAIGNEAFKGCKSLVKVRADSNAISQIGQGAFEHCISLKEFTGKLRLSKIEDRVFRGCTELKKIDFGGFVESIGKCAFAHCINLKEIPTKRGTLSFKIGVNAFLNCEQMRFPVNFGYLYRKKVGMRRLTLYGFVFRQIRRKELDFLCNFWNQEDVVIPRTCMRFESGLFNKSKVIKTIKVPEGITALPERAFENCFNLESVRLPRNLKIIPKGAFLNCRSLRKFVFEGFPDNTIPEDVVIEQDAFSGCASIIKVKLPDTLTRIEKNTFLGCKSLRNIELPKQLTRIGMSAFQACESLENIEIPAKLEQISYCAFMGCKSLRRVLHLEQCRVQKIENDAFKGCTSLQMIRLPETLRHIGAGAFYSCHLLKNIELPKELTTIGMAAFEECYALQSIEIPPKVTKIEKFTFKYCSSLRSVDHLNTITEIGISAFYNCNQLQEFRMPRKVMEIGACAFAFCSNFEEIEIPKTVCSLPEGLFEGCTLLKTVKLPEHITEISINCFKDCVNLTEINLPEGLKRIGAGGFRNCHSYAPAALPDTLEEIQASAFRFCDNISSISLPDPVKEIAVSAFGGCANLQKIEFPAVEEVDNYAFSNCFKLSETPIQKIKNRIGIGTFKECSALTEIHFSDTITKIDSSAFRGCKGIKQLEFPPTIKKISGAAFRENTALEMVRIPETMEIIGKSAFRDCMNLEEVEIRSEKLVIERNVFRGCRRLFDIDIPAGSLVEKSAFIDCPKGEYLFERDDIIFVDEDDCQRGTQIFDNNTAVK